MSPSRLNEKRLRIQVVAGPRQVGKTTAVKQALKHYAKPFTMGIEKYYEEIVRVKASSPKLAVCNTALMTAMLPYGFDELRSRHELWGHVFESAVGARLISSCRRKDIQLRYWNVGNKEVDFVLSKGDRLAAMEVKSVDADSVSGMKEIKANDAVVACMHTAAATSAP